MSKGSLRRMCRRHPPRLEADPTGGYATGREKLERPLNRSTDQPKRSSAGHLRENGCKSYRDLPILINQMGQRWCRLGDAETRMVLRNRRVPYAGKDTPFTRRPKEAIAETRANGRTYHLPVISLRTLDGDAGHRRQQNPERTIFPAPSKTLSIESRMMQDTQKRCKGDRDEPLPEQK